MTSLTPSIGSSSELRDHHELRVDSISDRYWLVFKFLVSGGFEVYLPRLAPAIFGNLPN